MKTSDTVWNCPPVIVVYNDSLVDKHEDRPSYLIVELQSGGLGINTQESDPYVYGKVIGTLPYTEAAEALMKSVGVPRLQTEGS